MTDRKYTIIYPSVSMPAQYLSGIESYVCGTHFQAHFCSLSSCAMPLTYEEAEFILKQINAQRPPYRPQLDSEGKPKFAPPPRYKIVELPWLNRIADKEVSDNE